jgi:hypothetical protein
MSVSDAQKKVALEFGKRAYAIHRAGGVTLSQALNQAFTATNPQDRAVITAAIIASLVGIDIEDAPVLARHKSKTAPGDLPPDTP